jgi:high affinity Mn2+ porin
VAQPLQRPLRTGITLAALALSVPLAQAADEPTPAATVRALAERLQQLEQRNAELERQVRVLGAGTPAGAASAAGGGTAARSAPPQAEVPHPANDTTEDDNKPQFTGGLVAVGQRIGSGASSDGQRQQRWGYRGDVTVTLPGGEVAGAQGTAFAHARFGQGAGVSLRPTHTSSVNSTAFQGGSSPDDTTAVLAQAWYQLEWPLGADRFNGQKGSRVELTVGKIDFFGFFDQNAVAADEAAQFLNNAFVHNPLLDSGGDIAADAYGFAPGLRVAYTHMAEGWSWGVSGGVFGSGPGANFSGNVSRPLSVIQLQVSPMQINGEPRGTYRVYAWTNGNTVDRADNPQRHTGWGVSLDQRVGQGWNLFGRYGQRTRGEGAFDRVITLGVERSGRGWGRGGDTLGLAYGRLSTGSNLPALNADGSDAGFAASGAEQIVELYYRIKVNATLAISPDLQWIRRPGGNGMAPAVQVVGLRATLGF